MTGSPSGGRGRRLFEAKARAQCRGLLREPEGVERIGGDGGGVRGPGLVAAARGGMNCERGFRPCQSLGKTAGVEQQTRVVALVALGERMPRGERLITDGNGPAKKWFRFLRAANRVQPHREIVEALGGRGMLRAEHCHADRKCALVKRPRLRIGAPAWRGNSRVRPCRQRQASPGL
jgi:hypothetical protein